MNEKNFEINFRNECKRLRYKKYQLCDIIKITMPTLKTKIENPDKFTWREIRGLESLGFDMVNNLNANFKN